MILDWSDEKKLSVIENVYQERTIFNPDIVAKVERELGIRTAKK